MGRQRVLIKSIFTRRFDETGVTGCLSAIVTRHTRDLHVSRYELRHAHARIDAMLACMLLNNPIIKMWNMHVRAREIPRALISADT